MIFRTFVLLIICLLANACKSTLPVVHYDPLGNNSFLQKGKVYLYQNSSDSIRVLCTFLSGTSTESVFFVHVENLSEKTVEVDAANFYMLNGDSSLSTVLIGAIDPKNKLEAIEEELSYYHTKSHKLENGNFQHNKSTQPRVDAKFQMKQLLQLKEYWKQHTLQRTLLAPKQTAAGDVVFTWTKGSKISTIHLPIGKEVFKFTYAQKVILP